MIETFLYILGVLLGTALGYAIKAARDKHEDYLIEQIDSIPAADVRPVVHGYWTWNPNGMDWGRGAWCCNKCRAKAETWWGDDRGYNPLRCSGGHYCGNCGAEMKGVQNG